MHGSLDVYALVVDVFHSEQIARPDSRFTPLKGPDFIDFDITDDSRRMGIVAGGALGMQLEGEAIKSSNTTSAPANCEVENMPLTRACLVNQRGSKYEFNRG